MNDDHDRPMRQSSEEVDVESDGRPFGRVGLCQEGASVRWARQRGRLVAIRHAVALEELARRDDCRATLREERKIEEDESRGRVGTPVAREAHAERKVE